MIRLIAGLGNDDEKYHLTFHNAGFWAVRALAARLKLRPRETKGYTLYSNDNVSLITAHSYINVCGPHIREALMKSGGDPASALIVSDDFMLPEGKLRLRRGGSAGGHNGLKSVIEFLATDAFPRLRVGVGPVPERMDPAIYVLKKVSADRLEALAEKAADALEACLSGGVDVAMNKFNAG